MTPSTFTNTVLILLQRGIVVERRKVERTWRYYVKRPGAARKQGMSGKEYWTFVVGVVDALNREAA